MLARVTCKLCGHTVETNLEREIDTSAFSNALRFLQEQTQEHHHPEVKDSFKWTLGWQE